MTKTKLLKDGVAVQSCNSFELESLRGVRVMIYNPGPDTIRIGLTEAHGVRSLHIVREVPLPKSKFKVVVRFIDRQVKAAVFYVSSCREAEDLCELFARVRNVGTATFYRYSTLQSRWVFMGQRDGGS